MTMKQEKKRIYLQAALALIALLAVLLALDNLSFVPSMLLTVLRKGAIYALVAVSMNLLNGFTGLFSLGQAGFMLLRRSPSISAIPMAASVFPSRSCSQSLWAGWAFCRALSFACCWPVSSPRCSPSSSACRC